MIFRSLAVAAGALSSLVLLTLKLTEEKVVLDRSEGGFSAIVNCLDAYFPLQSQMKQQKNDGIGVEWFG